MARRKIVQIAVAAADTTIQDGMEVIYALDEDGVLWTYIPPRQKRVQEWTSAGWHRLPDLPER